MANLRTAIDSAFWDLNIASPQTLDGWAKAVPGDPFPLDASVASRLLRPQQFNFFSNALSHRIIPSLSPTSPKDLGSFSLQSLFKIFSPPWWLAMTGQFRPRKLITNIKNEISNADEFDLSTVKDVAKHFIDKSLFSFGLTSQFTFPTSTSMLFSVESHGEKEKRRYKMMAFHKLPDHDLTLEAAWPQLFVDHKGKYWDVPESLSVDLSSLVSDSGLRYHFGIHKNGGNPQAMNATDGNPPLPLLPGLCAKAAFTYEKIKYFWRDMEAEEDDERQIDKVLPYDVRLKGPHAAVSGILGSTCASWIWNGRNFSGIDSENLEGSTRSKRSRLNADLFGSVCYTFQHGKFTKDFGDLTRVDARLDISSASALAKKIMNGFKSSTADVTEQASASPRLNLIFQQQVGGPVVFRADSRILLESFTRKHGVSMEDFICSLSYSFRSLQSGKVVAWYSPKRKEGMVELRLFEF
ncbi:protein TRIGALACTOSYLDIACYLGLYCEROL 4, chloroplastic [Gastrolobium bilobum]|uniref:protein TRIGALACTOSYLDIACYLGLYCEROL 4, chloroplastic n=1 Tax=Gastrolobium bilobum TaxID=150636 RepID=UPI002AB04E7C|nr:protein TRIGALACTOSYLDIACYLGLYCEROL 4, chloroplastic [Gastrolobium bilobum]